MLARLVMTLEACFALISNSPAIALTRAPLVMGLAAFSFMAFMLLGGNIFLEWSLAPKQKKRSRGLLES